MNCTNTYNSSFSQAKLLLIHNVHHINPNLFKIPVKNTKWEKNLVWLVQDTGTMEVVRNKNDKYLAAPFEGCVLNLGRKRQEKGPARAAVLRCTRALFPSTRCGVHRALQLQGLSLRHPRSPRCCPSGPHGASQGGGSHGTSLPGDAA